MAKINTVSKPELKFDHSFNYKSLDAGILLMFMFICYWVMKPVMDMPPQRDSGCFLYIGQNWLNGMIPVRIYIDV